MDDDETMDPISMTITNPNYRMDIISLTLASGVFKKFFLHLYETYCFHLKLLKEQRMRFPGNGELHYLLFSIFYFFSNFFTSVLFLHHFPAIFT